MKIAFILLTHKSPVFLQRLVSRLSHPDAYIFIHVHKGADAVIQDYIKQNLANFPQLYFLPSFYSYWGSWGLVQASLSGLEQARQNNCDYAVLLSGQDYLLQSITNLEMFLEKHKGLSFLQYHALPSSQWPPDGTSRYMRWHFNLGIKDLPIRKLANRALNRLFNTISPTRQFPQNLEPYGGWQWWCLERNAIDYMLDFTHKNPKVVNYFKTVRIPDEMYFHTVLLNSPLASSIQNRLLTFADWKGPPYPRILLRSDFNQLSNDNYFFARKFDPNIDHTILDKIDHELLHI